MGVYVMKVSPRAIGTLNGRPVFPSKFAYKPYASFREEDRKVNAQMHFRSGAAKCCAAWDALPEGGRRDVLVLDGDVVREFPSMGGVFYDDCERPILGSVLDLRITDRDHAKRWVKLDIL